VPPIAGPPRLLTVNYLHPRKRVDLIIEAAAELMSRFPAGAPERPLLTVVGDGPERANLEALAVRRGIADRVEFAGFVAESDLPGYYWRATCYVHATRDESFGLSVIEASYCGRPIVAVDEGGVRDTVEDGVTGYRVAATPTAIAEAVARVLWAPDGGAELGAAGRAKIAAEFRWSRGAEDLVRAARGVAGF
jgi:glycosyltransferase involved in cell wall biosynthesis